MVISTKQTGAFLRYKAAPQLFLLALSLSWSTEARGQSNPGETQPKNESEVIDCKALPTLSGLLKTRGPRARCRIELQDLVCLPGSILTKDVKQDRDLCLNQNKKPIQEPRCAGKKREKYTQRIVERGYYRVDYPTGESKVELLDLPFTTASRKDVLARAKPILRPGPDGCVYFRRELVLMGKEGEQR